MTTTYSNPRLYAIIENWPHGRERVTATFSIETNATRGQRAVRTTMGAPKKLTYARKARIVDGDDGRTYIAELSPSYNHINIMHGNMKFNYETIFANDPRYDGMLALFA